MTCIEAYRDQLTCVANDGWERPEARCPHIFSSRCSDAWHLGAELRRKGLPRPSNVKSSRGDSLRLNRHQIVRVTYENDGTTRIHLPA